MLAVVVVAQPNVNGCLLAQWREQLLERLIVHHFTRQPGGITIDNHTLRAGFDHLRNNALEILPRKEAAILVFRFRWNVGVREQREVDGLSIG